MQRVIDAKEMEGVFKASPKKRYGYFIKHVAGYEKVWGLRNKDGWVLTGDDDGNTYMPFWPAKEYAELFINDEWSDCHAESIDVYEFIDEFLDNLEENKIYPSIFKMPHGDTIMVSHYDLKNNIIYALDQVAERDNGVSN